ncbi:MAG: Crp/Fnr family transcriptional regulator, partial [Prevotellaceae bacterium]|nr:Crp/Fnr family transcriptional regulator [Prevotellaceae bacterium]
MIKDNNLHSLLESKIEVTNLSIPSKTLLLEEGKVADRLFLINKGCLRLFLYSEGNDITFQFFFEGDFVASFDSLYKHTPSLFSL